MECPLLNNINKIGSLVLVLDFSSSNCYIIKLGIMQTRRYLLNLLFGALYHVVFNNSSVSTPCKKTRIKMCAITVLKVCNNGIRMFLKRVIVGFWHGFMNEEKVNQINFNA